MFIRCPLCYTEVVVAYKSYGQMLCPQCFIERFGNENSGNFGHAGRPGEVGGSLPQGESSSGSTKKVMIGSRVLNEHDLKRIKDLNNELFSKTRVDNKEHAYIFAENGQVIKIAGDDHSVSFKDLSYDETQMLRGSSVVHTHPNNSCFSEQDVLFARINELSNMKVVTKDNVYTLSPKDGTWRTSVPPKVWFDTYVGIFNEKQPQYKKVYDRLLDEIYHDEMMSIEEKTLAKSLVGRVVLKRHTIDTMKTLAADSAAGIEFTIEKRVA